MFDFADLRFRPLEKDDLKLLHVWENDFELIMYSRSKTLNVASMAQLEKKYEEWMKKEHNLYFIVENMESEPIGFATIRRRRMGKRASRRYLHIHLQKGALGKGLWKEDNCSSA